MKLQQLRYVWEVTRHNLNVSETAQSLYTSQPGISKQIRLLEDELKLEIFARSGKHLTHVTPAGEEIVRMAGEIVRQSDSIKQLAQEYSSQKEGSLSIATTNTQAKYSLPEVVKEFRSLYPDVTLQMHQGSPEQIASLAAAGEVDFAITTENFELSNDLIMMPCYKWNRSIVVPEGHPLADADKISLELLGQYPIVTYVFWATGRSTLDEAFKKAEVNPNVVFTATDADVIKSYVKLGLGIGIVAGMAFDPIADEGLVNMSASHLFDSSVTHIGFRRGTFLRKYMLDFIEKFAPHLDHWRVKDAVALSTGKERIEFFNELELPTR
jgi:LysR family cys regulon transcriptional activator